MRRMRPRTLSVCTLSTLTFQSASTAPRICALFAPRATSNKYWFSSSRRRLPFSVRISGRLMMSSARMSNPTQAVLELSGRVLGEDQVLVTQHVIEIDALGRQERVTRHVAGAHAQVLVADRVDDQR